MTGQAKAQRRLTSLAMWLAHLHVTTQEQREAVENYALYDLIDDIVVGLNGDPSASGPRYHVSLWDREARSIAEGCLLVPPPIWVGQALAGYICPNVRSGPGPHPEPPNNPLAGFGGLLAHFATLQSVLQSMDFPILIASSGQGRLAESLAIPCEDRTLDLGQKLRPR